MKTNSIYTFIFAIISQLAIAQTSSDSVSIFPAEKPKPLKIRHAEPLYMDLIRDLGARKGEKEWNVGYGIEGHKDYTINHSFVEYEFSPVNRLGLEVEVPFAFYRSAASNEHVEIPRNRIEGLKLASQYTFLVSKKHQMSMAAGYMHEFRAHSFYSIDHGRGMLKGHSVSPFFIVAKKWGSRINTMLYTGPEWEVTAGENKSELFYQTNASMHYVLPSGNFVGIEVNDERSAVSRQTVLRPQVKLILTPRLALGLLTGIPTNFHENGMSFMVRVIFEP
ncbi:HAEPLYID family protein [Dyadobacter luticola]|uniref:Phosphoribosylformylglycinamidine synthase n=1 Tax=Dyadobacter luticola TaxID=1979387 RepID=A0A5R9L1F2_9BACT|nr:HAEPLYID family protein [Dyadobacter luticola]TLV02110.1 phosphoribosylformylglycinamidine synthase [Dyadobacter luticola]